MGSSAEARGASCENIETMRLRILPTLFLMAVRPFAQPVALSGFSDEGTFLLYLNEEHPGRIAFSWKPDGRFESTFVLSLFGETSHSSLALSPDAEGRWVRSVFEDRHGKSVIERNGSELTLSSPEKRGKGVLPEGMLVFAETSPALISQALRRYDSAKGGSQTFGLLELSRDEGGPLTLESEDATERTVAGRTLRLNRWRYAAMGCELQVLAGDDGRVYLVTGLPWYTEAGVSEQHASYVREGYESLLPAPDGDPLISPPRCEVKVETNVKVPMRDGVKLATDLYLPIGAPKAPVILARTPYSKEGSEVRGYFWARRGYVYAIQDVRGRFASEGQWEAVINEPKDGYDSIEWLARQPWSSGKVGMLGGSYLGWVQWLAAIQHPPHLVTIVPNVSPPDPLHNMPYDHGGMWLMEDLHWLDIIETNAIDPGEMLQKNWAELLRPLPVIDLDKAVLGRQSPTWRHWMAHPTADEYWRGVMFLDKLKDIRIPVFHESGWFDGDGIGTKLNYLALAKNRSALQKLTIGPWGHSDTAMRNYGESSFGSAAVIDLQRDYLRWFDYWLKGADTGILKEPLVSMFVMGSNRWVSGPRYPLPETRFEKLYLAGGGRLSFTPPVGEQPADRYVYDPGDPTPDAGTADSCRDLVAAARKDILVYTTPAFEKPYTIAGPVSAVLYTSSSARDTDWFVHLTDAGPDGRCFPLWSDGTGKVRARYRNSMVKTELIEPGKVYKYTIDLWHTGITIASGHRLRAEVASASFPAYSRNLNTGGNNELDTRFVSASQTIYHDARRPSYILLPRIPE
jgi:uncharacterized protein